MRLLDKIRYRAGVQMLAAAQHVFPKMAWAVSVAVNMDNGMVAIADSSACDRAYIKKHAMTLVNADILARLVKMRAHGAPPEIISAIEANAKATFADYTEGEEPFEVVARAPGSWKVVN